MTVLWDQMVLEPANSGEAAVLEEDETPIWDTVDESCDCTSQSTSLWDTVDESDLKDAETPIWDTVDESASPETSVATVEPLPDVVGCLDVMSPEWARTNPANQQMSMVQQHCWALLSMTYQAHLDLDAIYQVWSPSDMSHPPFMMVVKSDQIGITRSPIGDFAELGVILGYNVRTATEREIVGLTELPSMTLLERVTLGAPEDLPDGLIVRNINELLAAMDEEPGVPIDVTFRLAPQDWSELGPIWMPFYTRLEAGALAEQRIGIDAGEEVGTDFVGTELPANSPVLNALDRIGIYGNDAP